MWCAHVCVCVSVCEGENNKQAKRRAQLTCVGGLLRLGGNLDHRALGIERLLDKDAGVGNLAADRRRERGKGLQAPLHNLVVALEARAGLEVCAESG